MGNVVTLSASFGAGGSVVGPSVARLLGLPFYDRAIPVAVAQRLSLQLDEALALDEHAPSRLERILGSFSAVAVPLSYAPEATFVDRRNFREETEATLRKIADGEGGVILGRAAMIVLKDHDHVFRVRLDGPVEARIAQAARNEHIDEEAVRSQQRAVDRGRDAYVSEFYGVDRSDPSLYHVVLDSTALTIKTCVETIATAARMHFEEF